ncbi:MAG TPA: V-type ATPase subunit [Longilinea sp.]|nr:V-type ATPase subunit [Longilinea sp.]
MPGGASEYSAINARVRAMYSTQIKEHELTLMFEVPDFDSLIEVLKHTVYGPYLDKEKTKALTPRRAAFQIRGHLADTYISIIRMAPQSVHSLLAQRYRYFEVDNLKAILRGIVTGASWDRVRFVLFPLGAETVLPAQEMMETGNVAGAVELLRDTPYYPTLSFAMKRYSAEQNLFPLEVALDLNYWRERWKDVNQLAGDDRTQAVRIIGSLVDMNNLMWAIRYRVYHHLSEEELINYTLPFGYRVHDRDIRAIAAGADIAQVVKRIYPSLPDVDALLQDPHKGLPELESLLRRMVKRQCETALTGNPFHIGVPLAYLTLSEFEVQDLVVLMEAKSAQMPYEAFRTYLMLGQSPIG